MEACKLCSLKTASFLDFFILIYRNVITPINMSNTDRYINTSLLSETSTGVKNVFPFTSKSDLFMVK
jgi:hypothetical protein